ncbi:MAG: KH domain-containing protein [Patescibacteria group bacterium]|nr:KH domain-containing protein [Patescibacteria group bacterium]
MSNIKQNNLPEDKIKNITQSLLLKLGVKSGVEVKVENDVFYVDIDAFDAAGLLIGKKGQNLQSLQTVINLIYKNQNSQWAKIIVNIAGWKEKEERRLQDIANQAALRAIETGQPQHLYNLNSAQRRIVHISLSQRNDVETFSEGEGTTRYLVIRRK